MAHSNQHTRLLSLLQSHSCHGSPSQLVTLSFLSPYMAEIALIIFAKNQWTHTIF
jgi:hypothetical protein